MLNLINSIGLDGAIKGFMVTSLVAVIGYCWKRWNAFTENERELAKRENEIDIEQIQNDTRAKSITDLIADENGRLRLRRDKSETDKK